MATSPEQAYGDQLRTLLDALLASRLGAAATRFEEELAAALAAGEVTSDAADRLRAWHRAAVREVDEHVRATVPTALSALAAARTDAEGRADAVDRALESPRTGHGRQHPPPSARPHRDTPGHGTSPLPPAASTLGSRPPRQMLADLVRTTTPTYRDDSTSDPRPAETTAEVS